VSGSSTQPTTRTALAWISTLPLALALDELAVASTAQPVVRVRRSRVVVGQVVLGDDLEFFVLSGFLITGILTDAKGAPHYFRNFYLRRAIRIFPLYYAVVFASLVLIPALVEHVPSEAVRSRVEGWGRIEGSEIWYWTYLSNFSIAYHDAFRHGILDVSWSLAIEEQFYLVWPALVLAFSRRGMMRLCVAAIVGSMVFRTALVVAGVGPIAIGVLTFSRLDALAMGSLLALVARERPGGILSLRPAARRLVAVGGGVALAAVALDLAFGWTPENPDHATSMGTAMQTVGFTGLAALFGGVLVLGVCAPPDSRVGRLLAARGLVVFGTFSYAIYLTHLPVRALLRELVGPFGQGTGPVFLGSTIPIQLVFYVVAGACALGVGWLSWHLFEKRCLRLKRFFPYASRGEAPPVRAPWTAPEAPPSGPEPGTRVQRT
jgi:peptidoglycan/LPS O-acetylase OafA/YrhL